MQPNSHREVRNWFQHIIMEIRLPKLGEGAESGTVASILVKVGDTVAEGQTIMELENEKAVAPIPAPTGGRVTAIRVKEGDKLSAGQVILTLDEGQGKAASSTGHARPASATEPAQPEAGAEATAEEESPSAEPEDTSEAAEETEPDANQPAPAASPSIRKMARELGIDLRRVRGTERGGRIIVADLRAYIQRLQKLAFQPQAGKAKAPAPAPSAPAAEPIDFAKWGSVSRKPMSSLRQTISRRMTENWNTIPHVTQFDDADITGLNALRKKYASAYEQAGTKLTLTSFALKAVADTLQKHPVFNCSLDEASREIVFKAYYHLGLAVDTEQGLIVPVIRDVDKKDLLQLSKDVSALADKARERKVASDELKGGTFTISNQGGIGGAHFTPIINKPEVAILGLGRGAQKAVVRDGKLEPRWIMPLALSYDHRIIDGASAARFIVDLVAAFESFSEASVKR